VWDNVSNPRSYRKFYPTKHHDSKQNYPRPKDEQCSLGSLNYQYRPRTFYPSKLNPQELSLNSQIRNRPLEGTTTNFRFYREFYPSNQSNARKIYQIGDDQNTILGVRANNIKVTNMNQSSDKDGLANCM